MKSFAIVLVILAASGCATTRGAKFGERDPTSREWREKVYFDFGKAEVRVSDQLALNMMASRLRKEKKVLAILEGHTDSLGPVRLNEILAEERARAVRVYLRDQGVDAHQTTILSKGEREPAVKEQTKKDRQLNRRVEIIVTLNG